MKLLNPIYDASFKHIMEDSRAARFFLSVLLDKQIELDSFKPQEISIRNEDRNTGYSTPRMDFIAVIIDGNKRKKVLIELQQCFYANDISRFRSYIGKNYISQDILNKDETKETLEIIAIYILGFSINTPVAVIKTSNELIDASTHEKIDITKENIDFIAKLNHQSFFIDVTKLNNKVKTRVEKLLAIFNPAYRDKESPTITLPDDIAQDIKSLSTDSEDSNPIITKLEKALYDTDVLYAIDQQEKFDHHIKNQEQLARREGEIKGRIEGEAKGLEKGSIEEKKHIAKSMKALNLSYEIIMQSTGLTKNDIDEDRKSVV